MREFFVQAVIEKLEKPKSFDLDLKIWFDSMREKGHKTYLSKYLLKKKIKEQTDSIQQETWIFKDYRKTC